MHRRRLLALAAAGVAGCSGQSPGQTPSSSPSPSESSCGPGATAIGDIERTGPYVDVGGRVERTSGAAILTLSDSTGTAHVFFQREYHDSVAELSEGDCVEQAHGQVTLIDEEGKVTLENARLG
jgi:hypothetical protein